MENVFSTFFQGNESRHQCTKTMERLLRTISAVLHKVHLDAIQDLVIALEQALAVTLIGNAASSRCHFCRSALGIVGIADHIQTKFDTMTKDYGLLWSMRELEAMPGGFMEDLSTDCQTLKELLQSIMDIHENKETSPASSSLRANMFDGAHDLRIEGGNTTNLAGLSNSIIFVRQESGISFRSGLFLLFLAFLAFLLFRLL